MHELTVCERCIHELQYHDDDSSFEILGRLQGKLCRSCAVCRQYTGAKDLHLLVPYLSRRRSVYHRKEKIHCIGEDPIHCDHVNCPER